MIYADTYHPLYSRRLYIIARALPCFVPGCRLVPFKIAASGAKLHPPRNDKTDRFCWKTERFSEQNVWITMTKRSKNDAEQHRAERPYKAKTSVSQTKVWHPVAKHGSTRREEIPITGTARRAIPTSPLSLPHFQIPVRSVSSCFVPGWQIVPFKIATSGAKNCALLAMTNLIGLLRLDPGLARTETR